MNSSLGLCEVVAVLLVHLSADEETRPREAGSFFLVPQQVVDSLNYQGLNHGLSLESSLVSLHPPQERAGIFSDAAVVQSLGTFAHLFIPLILASGLECHLFLSRVVWGSGHR